MSAFRVILIQFLDVLYRIIVYLCFARQDAVRHSQISEQVHICLCAHLSLSLFYDDKTRRVPGTVPVLGQ